MDVQVYNDELLKFNQFLKDNSQKLHKIAPLNPTIKKDDEWADENEWDELYKELENNGD